jgi:hypothetical protein
MPLKIHVGTREGLFTFAPEQERELEGRSLSAVAPTQNGLWAVLDRHHVWRRTPTGWEPVAEVKSHELTCLLPVRGAGLAGTSEAHLMRVSAGAVEPLPGFEASPGRDQWFTPWGGPPDVRSLAAAPSGALYANVHVGGILRSDDGGSSWFPTIDIHSDVHEVLVVDEDTVLAATAAGLGLSRDRGASWSFDDVNLHASYARAVGLCGDTILMSACVGPHGGRAALYRRPLLGEGRFEKCRMGLPDWFSENIDTGWLATSDAVAAMGTSDGQLFLSEDAGRSWQVVAEGLPRIQSVVLD